MKKLVFVSAVATLLVFSVAALGGCLPVLLALSARGGYVYTTIDGNRYEIAQKENEATLITFADSSDGVYSVPESVTYRGKNYPVRYVGQFGEPLVNDCASVHRFEMSSSVRWMDRTRFWEMPNLSEITVASGNADYRSYDGVLYYRNDDESFRLRMECYPAAKRDLTVNLPDYFSTADDDSMFWQNEFVAAVNVADSNPYYKAKDGVLYSKDGATLALYPPQRQNETFVAPAEMRGLAADCRIWDNVYLKRVDSEGDYFKTESNSLLTSDGNDLVFAIPDGVCYAIPDGVRVVAQNAFKGVKYLYVPSSVIAMLDIYGAGLYEIEAMYFQSDILPAFAETGDFTAKTAFGCTRAEFDVFAKLTGGAQ